MYDDDENDNILFMDRAHTPSIASNAFSPSVYNQLLTLNNRGGSVDPGQLDYRQMIATRERNTREKLKSNNSNGVNYSGKGTMNVANSVGTKWARDYYIRTRGGADPGESSSSSSSSPQSNQSNQIDEDEFLNLSSIPDIDIPPKNSSKDTPIARPVVNGMLKYLFEQFVTPDEKSLIKRNVIFEQDKEGKIMNNVGALLYEINTLMKKHYNIEGDYSYEQLSEYIFSEDNYADFIENMRKGIEIHYEKVGKLTNEFKISKTELIYIMLSITGPIEPNDRKQINASTGFYSKSLLNNSFEGLGYKNNLPTPTNAYGPSTKNELDVSAVVEADNTADNIADNTEVVAAVKETPTQVDDKVLIATQNAPTPVLTGKINVADRVRMILQDINTHNADYIQQAVDDKQSGSKALLGLKKEYSTLIYDALKELISDAKSEPVDKRYPFYDIDNEIFKLGEKSKIVSRIRSALDTIFKKDKNTIGKKIVAKTLFTVPTIIKQAAPAAPKTPEEFNRKYQETVIAAKYEDKPVEKTPEKLDTKKFQNIIKILSTNQFAAQPNQEDKNIEVVKKLSGDKVEARALLETLFKDRQPLKVENPEIANVIKIPKAPPLLPLGTVKNVTQAMSSKASALASSGYPQTPKDSLITTLTVISLLQPILQDDVDASIKLAAGKALLMGKAYDDNTINAIDEYLKAAIDDKLVVLRNYSSAYSQAEESLLRSMLEVLNNKTNPSNPSKLFRYSTYMKSSKSTPLVNRTAVKGKVDYLKSIDQGVKDLNINKTTKKTPTKKPTKTHTKGTTKPTTRKIIKSNVDKQKARNVRIKAAMTRLKSRGEPGKSDQDIDKESEDYIKKVAENLAMQKATEQ